LTTAAGPRGPLWTSALLIALASLVACGSRATPPGGAPGARGVSPVR
ncbi:Cmx/CmrA family chloramphenicol efflux MFS transporter, partial [Streptomyces sp. SID11385]|nr:Cmx/CmrA family chloramphenicol efflux MFS transporter [Streptomyces sp. SID11385]